MRKSGLVSFGGMGEVGHPGHKSSRGDHRVERNRRQRLPHRAIDRRPMRPGRAVGRTLAFGHMDRALGEADVAIDRGNDLGDRDRRRRAGKTIAAGGTPRGPYQTCMRQGLQ